MWCVHRRRRRRNGRMGSDPPPSPPPIPPSRGVSYQMWEYISPKCFCFPFSPTSPLFLIDTLAPLHCAAVALIVAVWFEALSFFLRTAKSAAISVSAVKSGMILYLSQAHAVFKKKKIHPINASIVPHELCVSLCVALLTQKDSLSIFQYYWILVRVLPSLKNPSLLPPSFNSIQYPFIFFSFQKWFVKRKKKPLSQNWPKKLNNNHVA